MAPRRSDRKKKPTEKVSDNSDSNSSPLPAVQHSSPVPAPLKVIRRRTFYPPVDPDTKMWQSDFKAIGFSDEQIGILKKVKEPVVDATTQIVGTSYHHRKAEHDRLAEAFRRKVSRKSNSPNRVAKKNGKPAKAQIQLKDKWVLFNPARGYPPTLETAPPPIFQHYEEYKPGNRKILALNLESFAIKLQKTPANFGGCEVEYSAQGVKLVKLPARMDSVAAAGPAEE